MVLYITNNVRYNNGGMRNPSMFKGEGGTAGGTPLERTLHHRPEEGDMKGMMDLKVLWKMEGVRYLSHPPQDLKRPYIPGC